MATAKKKPMPPWLKDKAKDKATESRSGKSSSGSSGTDGRGKQSTPTKPSTATSKDQRLQGRGSKPGAKRGTAAAKKGSAAGGRASSRKKK